jgi:hypothetical protein
VVVAQWAYGPYGEVRLADWKNPNSPTRLACGHQGLFFIRLDGSVDDPPLAPGAVGLYYNRNRWYSPYLGRFLQRDVNETAMPIIIAAAFNGDTLDRLFGAFDGRAHDAIGGDPARQGANVAVLERPLRAEGDLNGLFAVGGRGDGIVERHVHDPKVDLRFRPPCAGSNTVTSGGVTDSATPPELLAGFAFAPVPKRPSE